MPLVLPSWLVQVPSNSLMVVLEVEDGGGELGGVEAGALGAGGVGADDPTVSPGTVLGGGAVGAEDPVGARFARISSTCSSFKSAQPLILEARRTARDTLTIFTV